MTKVSLMKSVRSTFESELFAVCPAYDAAFVKFFSPCGCDDIDAIMKFLNHNCKALNMSWLYNFALYSKDAPCEMLFGMETLELADLVWEVYGRDAL